ncbi:MAG: integrase core domain-containing protein [Phycisphaerae bacterium]
MTEENHCYENGKAERLNGILKQELGMGASFTRKAMVATAVAQAVEIYNQCRPHWKLNMRVPEQVHGDGIIPEKIERKTRWGKKLAAAWPKGVGKIAAWGGLLRSGRTRCARPPCAAQAPPRDPPVEAKLGCEQGTIK